jgi:uncharacterized membrane protein YfbV (UPF0208 family)
MRVAFITETNHQGKWPKDFINARTEIAWQIALDADHYNIFRYEEVKGYDHIFIIFPKGKTFLSAEGSKLVNAINPVSDLLNSNLIEKLKENNKKVYYVQEGPHWWYNDYEILDQINFYNLLAKVDKIFAHNYSDLNYYAGLFPNKDISLLPTLMIEDSIKNIEWKPEEKAIIGGNFARWYGGFESFMVAQEFKVPVWGQTSHAMRDNENQLVQHLPRVMWVDWIKQLSTFKYAVHLMPTVAAGTFSLNCSYLGIPCIGNILVDTQDRCQPDLAVEVQDVMVARDLAKKLVEDKDFYEHCSKTAKENYRKYYDLEIWKSQMKIRLDEEC